MKCEFCGCEHNGSYGSGRFCSFSCKQKFANKRIKYIPSKTKHHCDVCNVDLESTKDFIAHKKTEEHKKKVHRGPKGNFGWKCKICCVTFSSRSKLENHKRMFGHSYSKLFSVERREKIAKASRDFFSRMSDEEKKLFREKISKATKGKTGGVRINGGRGKHGWYKGIWCDSSWELVWVIYSIDHSIGFVRCGEYFTYNFDGKNRKYFPDFILENGSYVEIKGYYSRQWVSKFNDFPKDKNLIVIGKEEIQKYLDYAISKYGKNFVRLYES